MSPVRLYAVPASHPSAAVEAALRLKGLDYRRIDLVTVAHRPLARARFGTWTVPVVLFEAGSRALGSRAIMRELDRRTPEPPLLPAERDARARVERAEQWGEEVLQPLARRVTWSALRRAPHAMRSYLDGAKLPLPPSLAMLGAPLVARAAVRINGAGDAEVRADLAALDAHLGGASTTGSPTACSAARGQRRRPPDRLEPQAAADARRPRAADRRPAGR